VIEKCASKLKPYLLPAIKSRGAALNDYSKVVANVCQMASEAVEPSDGDAASKNLVWYPFSLDECLSFRIDNCIFEQGSINCSTTFEQVTALVKSGRLITGYLFSDPLFCALSSEGLSFWGGGWEE